MLKCHKHGCTIEANLDKTRDYHWWRVKYVINLSNTTNLNNSIILSCETGTIDEGLPYSKAKGHDIQCAIENNMVLYIYMT